jgi:hypothetical protein
MDVCGKCGVPLMVSRDLNWESNGIISLRSSPRNRMVFFESENIDLLFKGIEELIGVQLEHMVIESRCRETLRYIQRAFPPEMRETVSRMARAEAGEGPGVTAEEKEKLLAAIKAITLSIIDISTVYGYGDQRPSDLWEEGADYPWRTQVIRNPYSLLFISADNLGSVEACEDQSMWVRHEKIGEDEYSIEVFPGEHPIELSQRLKRKRYDFKGGRINYERCPACGIPLEVARFRWDLREGTITDPSTGRRMAIFGPFAADAILQDLESELGESIPETIIEAQRRYIKSAWADDQWNREDTAFQHLIALRGLGDVQGFEGDRNHLTLKIQNSSLHLPVVGTAQALVELAYKVESSTCEWELSEDGDLTITVYIK